MKKKNKTKKNSGGQVSDISSLLKNQTLNQNIEDPKMEVQEITNKNVPDQVNEIGYLKDQNMYLKLLLGVSHKVDHLFNELKINFTSSDALSSPESFKRCLSDLDRDKETAIFVQTFHNMVHCNNPLF